MVPASPPTTHHPGKSPIGFFQKELGSPFNKIVTLPADLIQCLVHQLRGAITSMACDVLGQSATVNFTPGFFEPLRQTFGFVEHLIGYRYGSFHTERITLRGAPRSRFSGTVLSVQQSRQQAIVEPPGGAQFPAPNGWRRYRRRLSKNPLHHI